MIKVDKIKELNEAVSEYEIQFLCRLFEKY